MKILFLVHNRNNPNAGAARVYHMLTELLSARGHAVKALFLEDYGLPKNRTANVVAQRFLLPHFVGNGVSKTEAATYDVIMSSSGMAASLFRHLAKLPRRPILVNHLHGLFAYDHVANMSESLLGNWKVTLPYRLVTGPFQLRWDAAGIASADLTIVQNLRDLSSVVASGLDRARVRMIPLAVHPGILTASASMTPVRNRDPTRILWFATWESRKGSFYIPSAFRRIRADRPDARLTVGGTGQPEHVVKAMFAPQDQDSVIVKGFISVEEQAALLNESAVFLFPSLSEGYGLALLEGLSFGLAGVTTNTGFGADFLTDRVSARVVFPSSEHIALAVLELMNDAELRCRIAEAGSRVVRLFTPEKLADNYESLFLELVEARKAIG